MKTVIKEQRREEGDEVDEDEDVDEEVYMLCWFHF